MTSKLIRVATWPSAAFVVSRIGARIATRYDKLARNYFSALCFVVIWPCQLPSTARYDLLAVGTSRSHQVVDGRRRLDRAYRSFVPSEHDASRPDDRHIRSIPMTEQAVGPLRRRMIACSA